MRKYEVLRKGFYDGKAYDPDGKRRVLYTEGPFPMKNKKEQVPSWLKAAVAETPAQAKARKSAEGRSTAAAKKKADDDQKEIAGASFLGAPSTVETL